MAKSNIQQKAACKFRDQLFADSRKDGKCYHHNSNNYTWKGKIKPAEFCKEYRITIIANGQSIKTFVDGISKNDFGTVPHLYSDGSLCLYYPTLSKLVSL